MVRAEWRFRKCPREGRRILCGSRLNLVEIMRKDVRETVFGKGAGLKFVEESQKKNWSGVGTRDRNRTTSDKVVRRRISQI